AIAVYKRIAKLAPEEIRPLEKLADLYVQQGVMSEARPLFLQLAEIHLKNNRQPEAVGLLKKLLQAEPDNLRIQIRLADWDQASALAQRVFEADEKNFGPMQKVVESLLQAGNGEKAMEILAQSRLPMIDAGEHEVVGKVLSELAAGLPGRIEPLEWLVEL